MTEVESARGGATGESAEARGFDVDAVCTCVLVGRGQWSWIGWGSTPVRAVEQAAVRWAQHTAEVAR